MIRKTTLIISWTVAMVAMSMSPGLALAESNTVSAVIPWQGQGQIFPIATDKLRFLGSLEGIMYLETVDGAMNEAFVRCPIVQSIDRSNGNTSASGNCVIVVSTEDSAFAEINCEGITGLCRGDFKLTGGTGRFAGISGSGEMTIRSPVHALAADLTEGTVIHIAAGILQIPKLKYSLP